MRELNGTRDISIQECSNILLGLPLVHNPFKIITLHLADSRLLPADALEGDPNEEVSTKKNLVDHYANRMSEEYEQALQRWPSIQHMSLGEFAKRFYFDREEREIVMHPSPEFNKNVKKRVLRCIPNYSWANSIKHREHFWKRCKYNLIPTTCGKVMQRNLLFKYGRIIYTAIVGKNT